MANLCTLPFRRRLFDNIQGRGLEWQLLSITLATGVLDAVSYGQWGVFASNQTGNVILLIANSITKLKERQATSPKMLPPLPATGTSLAAFLLSGFISGRIGLRLGHRKRFWFFVSGCFQSLLLLLVAILTQMGVLQACSEDQRAALPVGLLAIVGGLQVSQARCSGVNEVPTAMLTSPMMDLINLPELFSKKQHHSRSLRFLYMIHFIAGIALGSVVHAFAGTAATMYLGFSIRALGSLCFLVQPGVASAPATDMEQ